MNSGKYARALCTLLLTVCTIAAILTSCSTNKNTAQTRFWHSFNTRYNVYYNGNVAYIDASLEKEKGNKDNYTERIPLYTVGNKASRDIGKGNYDKAIEKSQKSIKLHSINAKPKWTKSRPKNEKEIEYYSRREYNPFLWKAWMLMGRSQFYKGAFDDAASTFSWMARMYKTQPAIYGKARAWLAKCYIEEGWIYDAEDIIRNMQRDSIDWRAQKEWDYTLADYYLHTEELDKATEYLKKVIKHEMRSKQRAREYFLLGQIEAAQGNKQAAYRAFKKVVSQNPPYELEFNARIAMTEVLAQGQAKKMIGKLKRMARNDNNKEYLDQVYYAMGNIYLAQKDTANAIASYEKGNEKATRSGIEKGVLLLHLGDLYWEKEKYGDAQRCYGAAIGMLDKDRPDYKQLSDRSKVLDELVPYTDGIYLQDSLQVLAKMDEKDRNAAIDRVIDALKKKEKEERDRQAEAEAQRIQQKNGAQGTKPDQSTLAAANNRQQVFYFYNPTAVQQGKQAFERQWGKRDNVDDWQRINKTVVSGLFGEADNALADSLANMTDEQRDSIASLQEAEEAKNDSAVNDPHKREYYLAQIPFTEEQIEASNAIILDGLFHSGIIFKDKLDNLALSEKQFARLMRDFPDFETMDEVYYHLFLLHSRRSESEVAEMYVNYLKERYPDSKWTTVVTDPYFEENALFGKHIEDSLYTATYEAFLADRFDEVEANARISDTRFIMGANRDKFIFVRGLSLLNAGQADSCVARMEQVVKEFPKSSVSPIAGMIINGVKEGRKLRGANFSMADIWDRRTAVLADGDSIEAKKLSEDRDVPFTFMFVYNPDSIAENQLLFQLARFNFSTFVVRNFELEIEPADGLHRMMVTGFRSFDEAKLYMNVLYSSSEAIKQLTKKARAVVISDQNLPLLGTSFSYNDYADFYIEHFQPLNIEREYMLYEPDEAKPSKGSKPADDTVAPILPSEEVAPGGAAPVAPRSADDEGDAFDEGEDYVVPPTFDIPVDDTIDIPANDAIDIPVDNAIELPADNAVEVPADTSFDIPADADATATDGEFIIMDNGSDTPSSSDELIIMEDDNTAGAASDDDIIIIDETSGENESEETIILDDSLEDGGNVEDEYYDLDGF